MGREQTPDVLEILGRRVTVFISLWANLLGQDRHGIDAASQTWPANRSGNAGGDDLKRLTRTP